MAVKLNPLPKVQRLSMPSIRWLVTPNYPQRPAVVGGICACSLEWVT